MGGQTRRQSASANASNRTSTRTDGGYRTSSHSRDRFAARSDPFGADGAYGYQTYVPRDGGRRGSSGGSVRGGGSGGQSRRRDSERQTDEFPKQAEQDRYRDRYERRQYVAVYGRVRLASRDLPATGLLVKLDCGTGPIPQGYTDSKGYFSFMVGCTPSMLLSVEAHGRRGFLEYDGQRPAANPLPACDLIFEAPGYIYDRARLRGPFFSGGNDLGTIELHRLGGVKGDVASATTWMAPKAARKAYKRGVHALRRKKPIVERSLFNLTRAVESYPKFAEAWSALGEAQLVLLGDREGARKAFEKALEADPRFLRPYAPLMDLVYYQEDWEALEALGTAYLKLSPNASKALFQSAMAAAKLDKLARAQELVQVIKDRGEMERWPLAYLVSAFIHERRAEFEQAAAQYREFLRLEPTSAASPKISRRLYEWQELQVIAALENVAS